MEEKKLVKCVYAEGCKGTCKHKEPHKQEIRCEPLSCYFAEGNIVECK